jgi:hypothetical protein
MFPVVVQAGVAVWAGVEDADGVEEVKDAGADAGGVALGADDSYAPLLAVAVAVGPVAVGRLLSRLMVSTVATIASATTTPMTIQVATRRWRSGSEVMAQP